MSSGYIDLPVEGGGTSAGVTSLNSLDGVLSIVAGPGASVSEDGQTITIGVALQGDPNNFAGFDADGNLYSVPDWNINAIGGLNLEIQYDQSAGTNIVNIDADNSPTEATDGVYTTILDLFTNLDPNNTGFDIGNPTTGDGGITVVNAAAEQSSGSTANIGEVTIFGGGSGFGDGVHAAHMHNFSHMEVSVDVANNYTIDNVTGIGLFDTFDAGSIIGQYNGIQINPTINTNISNFSSGIGIFPNFGPSTTTAHWHSIESGGDGGGTAIVTEYLGLNLHLDNVHTTNYTNINTDAQTVTATNFTSINVSANAVTTTNFNFMNMFADSSSSATNVTGISINLESMSSPNQKTGLNINDGTLSITGNLDTSITTPSGVYGINQLGGALTVAAGHPISGAFGFLNNIGVGTIIEDDITDDGSGANLGLSVVGFVNQIEIAAGKTVKDMNYMAAGGGVSAGSGNVTNMSMFRALGFLPEGGTLNIANLVGFNADPLMDAVGATNQWSFRSNNSGSNYFKQNMVVGADATTMKPTNGSAGIELSSVTQAILTSRMTTTQKNALTALAGMVVFDTTLSQMSYHNGSAWVNF